MLAEVTIYPGGGTGEGVLLPIFQPIYFIRVTIYPAALSQHINRKKNVELSIFEPARVNIDPW